MNIALREAFVEIFDNKNLLNEFLKEVELQVPKNLRHKIPALPAQGNLDIKNVLGSYYFCS
jgi:DNA-directed RNA polymerase